MIDVLDLYAYYYPDKSLLKAGTYDIRKQEQYAPFAFVAWLLSFHVMEPWQSEIRNGTARPGKSMDSGAAIQCLVPWKSSPNRSRLRPSVRFASNGQSRYPVASCTCLSLSIISLPPLASPPSSCSASPSNRLLVFISCVVCSPVFTTLLASAVARCRYGSFS
jgi:hypothetical protein